MLTPFFSALFSRIRMTILALALAFLCIVPFLGTTPVSAASLNSKHVNTINASSTGNTCASFLQEYTQWATTSSGLFIHRLNFVVLYTEKDDPSNTSIHPLAAYATGEFGYNLDIARPNYSASHLAGDGVELFNDRTYSPSRAPFNNQSADTLGVRLDTTTLSVYNPLTHTSSLSSTVTATLTLKSWGNSTISFQPQCDHGVMYGSDNDHSLYTISLREYVTYPQS